MSFLMDDGAYGGQLFVGTGKPPALGVGLNKIRGSSYIEAPLQTGNDLSFRNVWATTMIGPLTNTDSPQPRIPGRLTACGSWNNSPYSLAVIGDAAIFDNLDVNRSIVAGRNIRAGRDIIAQGDVKSQCGGHTLSRKKNFDIPHPSKEGWRLRHTCPEGPTNDVYIRGRIKNKNEIEFPIYWKDFVDINSITVNLTPVGAHQNIIVKRIDEKKVYLQCMGNMPIDCFYHIFAERKDGEKLISEYPGDSPADYPGNNNEYSVSGYHYDIKEEK
jgi:hypothetical protein